MSTAIKVTRGLVGITGLIQLALGIVFWTGHLMNLIPFHMLTGVVFVLALWTLAGLTARVGAPVGLVVFTFVWGLVLPAFGMMQMNLLPGPWHWVIRTVHLLTGLVAMRLGDLLFRKAHAGGTGGVSLVGQPKENTA
jgi:hypothetical protein